MKSEQREKKQDPASNSQIHLMNTETFPPRLSVAKVLACPYFSLHQVVMLIDHLAHGIQTPKNLIQRIVVVNGGQTDGLLC